MDIIKIKHRDLLNFIQSNLYLGSNFYPISKIRAESQFHNPKATPVDDVLFTIYENNELVAYLGVLPDDIYFKYDDQNYHTLHVGWLSCIWVHYEYQGKGLAMKLLKEAYRSWEAKLLATEFTKEALNLYTKSQLFTDFEELNGYRLYFRSCFSKLLPTKNKKWKKLSAFLNLIDNCLNFFLDKNHKYTKEKNYRLEEFIDNQTWNFIKKHQSENELFKKNQSDLNWFLSYPWIINKNEDVESSKYYFSSVSKHFETKVFKIFDNSSELQAVIFFTNREGQIKIPFMYVNPDFENNSFEIFTQYLRSIKANTLTSYHRAFIKYVKNKKSIYPFKKEFKRKYLITNVLKKHIAESQVLRIQDGDGDSAFT